MLKIPGLTILAVLMLALLGCSSLMPGYEEPSVTVSSFRLLPANSINPVFEIGLHIINPNNSPLALKGLAYTASIEGHKVLAGVSNELPLIPAYGTGDVTVKASTDLFGGFRLISDLLSQQRQQLQYQLNVKLDIGSFLPAIRVEQQGEFSLSGEQRKPQ